MPDRRLVIPLLPCPAPQLECACGAVYVLCPCGRQHVSTRIAACRACVTIVPPQEESHDSNPEGVARDGTSADGR
jgi:hypothetical protein